MNGLTIISRSEWGAQDPTGDLTQMSSYDGFIIHHSVTAQPMNRDDGIATVKEVQRLHQEDNGWDDVGYNYLIDGAGNVYEGRAPVACDLARGAHAGSRDLNSNRIGICLLGCYHPPETSLSCNHTVTEAQRDSLVALCQYLIVRFAIDDPLLGGHRDHRDTACPGDSLYEMLPDIRARIGGTVLITVPEPRSG